MLGYLLCQVFQAFFTLVCLGFRLVLHLNMTLLELLKSVPRYTLVQITMLVMFWGFLKFVLDRLCLVASYLLLIRFPGQTPPLVSKMSLLLSFALSYFIIVARHKMLDVLLCTGRLLWMTFLALVELLLSPICCKNFVILGQPMPDSPNPHSNWKIPWKKRSTMFAGKR